jgi:hypothetical protein
MRLCATGTPAPPFVLLIMSSSHRNGRRNVGAQMVTTPTFYVEAAPSASVASSSKRGRRKSRSPGGQQRVPVTEVLNVGKKKRSIPSLAAHTDDMVVDRGRKIKSKPTTPLTQSRFAVENSNAPHRTTKKEKDRSKSRDLHNLRKQLYRDAQSESGFESQNDVGTQSDVAGPILPGLEVNQLKKEIEALKKVWIISCFTRWSILTKFAAIA